MQAAAAAAGQGSLKHGKTEFGRSSAVFAKLQQEQDAAKAAGGKVPRRQPGAEASRPALASAFLKL